MRIGPFVTAAAFGFMGLFAQGVAATAAEVKLMAGAAMSGAFGELVPQFERATGHKIVIQYGSTGTFIKQIEAGEAFDLVIIGSDGVDALIKQGKIAGDTRMDIARVGIGAAVRTGAPKPDISSVDAFKNTLLKVKSITYSPAGAPAIHLAKVFDRLGIAEQVKAKTKPNATDRVLQVVADGEVELAIHPTPAIASAKGAGACRRPSGGAAELVRQHCGHQCHCQATGRRQGPDQASYDTRGRRSHQGERHGGPRSVMTLGGASI
jgi:molybdate transport system substrate-binding protein